MAREFSKKERDEALEKIKSNSVEYENVVKRMLAAVEVGDDKEHKRLLRIERKINTENTELKKEYRFIEEIYDEPRGVV
jgi:hypothetical protein